MSTTFLLASSERACCSNGSRLSSDTGSINVNGEAGGVIVIDRRWFIDLILSEFGMLVGLHKDGIRGSGVLLLLRRSLSSNTSLNICTISSRKVLVHWSRDSAQCSLLESMKETTLLCFFSSETNQSAERSRRHRYRGGNLGRVVSSCLCFFGTTGTLPWYSCLSLLTLSRSSIKKRVYSFKCFIGRCLLAFIVSLGSLVFVIGSSPIPTLLYLMLGIAIFSFVYRGDTIFIFIFLAMMLIVVVGSLLSSD